MPSSESYKSTGGFQPQPPKFSWGGLILFLAFVGLIVGMAIYMNYWGDPQ